MYFIRKHMSRYDEAVAQIIKEKGIVDPNGDIHREMVAEAEAWKAKIDSIFDKYYRAVAEQERTRTTPHGHT